MATYTFLGGDSFDDPNNWYNVTAGKPDDGVPGPNDTIGGATAVIPAAGETVANAEGSTSKPVEISGGLTITGLLVLPSAFATVSPAAGISAVLPPIVSSVPGTPSSGLPAVTLYQLFGSSKLAPPKKV